MKRIIKEIAKEYGSRKKRQFIIRVVMGMALF